MWVNQDENKSCNFVAPAGLTDDQEVLFPAVDRQTPAYAATLAVPVKQMTTMVHLSEDMSGNVTINLAVEAQVTPGAKLHLKAASDGTARSITFGTGFSSPALAGTIDTTKVQSFIYDGTNFIPEGAALAID